MFHQLKAHTLSAFLVLLAVSGAVYGAELPVVKVTSSFPAGYNGQITASVDDGGTGLTLFTFKDSRGTQDSFTVEDVRKGVVLARANGKEVLKISGPNFTSEAGGEMILTFLKGFFGNDRRELRFEYIRNGGATDWLLQTNDAEGRHTFDSIYVYITKKLGVPTGVGSIKLSSGEKLVRKYNPNTLPRPKRTRPRVL